MRRLLLMSLPLFATGMPLCAQPQTTVLDAVSGPADIDRVTQTEDVPFREDGHNRMTVPVRLSGSGPYRFLVDTGSDRTAISRELAASLQLRQGNGAEVHSFGGVDKVATADVHGLQLTRKEISILNAPLLDRSDMGADGILGVDSLHSQRVVFDFETDTMSIVPAVARADEEREAIVIKARRRNGRLVVTEARANDRRVVVVLDTGAEISVGNSALRRQLLGNRPADKSRLVALVTAMGDQITGEYVFVRELEIGGVRLTNLGVIFADGHTFRKLDLDRKPALLLGMNAMRAFKKVSIDFAARKFRVVLPEHSGLRTQLAQLGRGGPARPKVRDK